MIPVIWLNYLKDIQARGYWDMGMLEDVFHNRMWITGYEFEDRFDFKDCDGAVVIMAARNQADYIDQLNNDLAKLKWVVLFLTGDEESVFPIEKIDHPNIKIWVMSPKQGRHERYSFLGTGYPPQMHELMPVDPPEKTLDYFFAGQITHKTREEMQKWLIEIDKWDGLKGEVIFTDGFTKGLKPADYFAQMALAKTVPAPSGPVTTDSFRLFEALEAGAIPITENREYWKFFFGQEELFPVLDSWEYLQGYIGDQIALYPSKHNNVFAWWQDYKRQMVLKIVNQIKELSGIMPKKDPITILMPTSPLSRHPSTEHIEQTIRDTRVQLPDTEIIILVDGVRDEQSFLKEQYEEYKRKLLWLCNYKWHNVRLKIFDRHLHQSGMVREVLPEIRTPLILFVEHDAPLDPVFPIPFDKLGEIILSGKANAIRLSHEGVILPEHKHLMIGEPEDIDGVPLLRTAQWSQRPHLASTAFYRYIIDTYYGDKRFIEHLVYGKIVEAYNVDGLPGWNLWKLWIYHPTGGNIKRSYDLNSRGNDPNFQ